MPGWLVLPLLFCFAVLLLRLAAADAAFASPGAGENISAAVVYVLASSAARKSEPTALQPIEAKFRMFHLNVNDPDCHLDLFDTLLSLHDFLEFVAITETHLAKSVGIIR